VNRPLLAAVSLLAATSLLLAGCASDPLADEYREGSQKNYVSGDGTVTEVPLAERAAPVDFEATTDTGETVSSADYRGQVLVLNFWYAACPPCRKEAPILQELNETFADDAAFLGVNVRDQAATSKNATEEWGVTFPSVIDANDGNMLLAYAGTVAPNAVPTTLVIDKQGRVAARYLGLLDSTSILNTLISDAIAEDD
jgi:peroxiredoxin